MAYRNGNKVNFNTPYSVSWSVKRGLNLHLVDDISWMVPVVSYMTSGVKPYLRSYHTPSRFPTCLEIHVSAKQFEPSYWKVSSCSIGWPNLDTVKVPTSAHLCWCWLCWKWKKAGGCPIVIIKLVAPNNTEATCWCICFLPAGKFGVWGSLNCVDLGSYSTWRAIVVNLQELSCCERLGNPTSPFKPALMGNTCARAVQAISLVIMTWAK